MEILYKALDGTIFTTQTECEDYEEKILNPNAILFGWNGEKVNDIASAYYLYVETDEDAKIFYQKYCRDTLPWDSEENATGGLFFCNDISNEWVSLGIPDNLFRVIETLKEQQKDK